MSKGNVIAYASLGSILVLTLLLRLYGIDWGMPTALEPNYSYHPDEAILLRWAQWLAQGRIAVKEFVYGGTFYLVILRACIYFGNIFRESIGGFNELANAILVARHMQVFLALLTALLIYECGRLFYGRRTGLVATLILSLSPAHIIATQTVRPDVISAFLVTLTVFIVARLLKSAPSEQKKLFMYSGIVIGVMTAFRLPLIGFGLLPVMAYVIARQRSNSDSLRRLTLGGETLWFVIIIGFTYAVLSPHTLMYPGYFIEGLKMTMKYESTEFPDAVDRGPIFFKYGWRLLHEALGYPGCFLVLGGTVYALVRRRDEDKILLAGIGLYFIMLASVTWTVVRYTLPMLPLLALLGGVVAIAIFEQARHAYARGVFFAMTGFILVWTLVADVALLHVVASKNVRELSSEWITRNIPRDKSILFIKGYVEDDFFNPAIPPYHSVSAALLTKGSYSGGLFAKKTYDYVVLNELLYADMERLGNRHPRKEVREFYENMKNAKLKLVSEIKVPVQFLGLDFSGWFRSMDYSVINPGIRIYQMP